MQPVVIRADVDGPIRTDRRRTDHNRPHGQFPFFQSSRSVHGIEISIPTSEVDRSVRSDRRCRVHPLASPERPLDRTILPVDRLEHAILRRAINLHADKDGPISSDRRRRIHISAGARHLRSPTQRAISLREHPSGDCSAQQQGQPHRPTQRPTNRRTRAFPRPVSSGNNVSEPRSHAITRRAPAPNESTCPRRRFSPTRYVRPPVGRVAGSGQVPDHCRRASCSRRVETTVHAPIQPTPGPCLPPKIPIGRPAWCDR